MCAAGSSSAMGGTGPQDCQCKAGFAPGPAASDGACVACEPGTYKETFGNASCETCGEGYYSLRQATECFFTCPSGSFGPVAGAGGRCVDCPPGKFSSFPNTKACTQSCPSHSQSQPGIADRSRCVCICACIFALCVHERARVCACRVCLSVLSVCLSVGLSLCLNKEYVRCVCNHGYTGPHGGPCVSCPANTYKAAAGSAGCVDCPAGTYGNTTGATSASSCLMPLPEWIRPCQAHKWRDAWDPFYTPTFVDMAVLLPQNLADLPAKVMERVRPAIARAAGVKPRAISIAGVTEMKLNETRSVLGADDAGNGVRVDVRVRVSGDALAKRGDAAVDVVLSGIHAESALGMSCMVLKGDLLTIDA